MTDRAISPELEADVHAIVEVAARGYGATTAADRATTGLMRLFASVDENAYRRGLAEASDLIWQAHLDGLLECKDPLNCLCSAGRMVAFADQHRSKS